MMEPGKMNRREWLRRSFLFTTLGTTFAVLGTILVDVWMAAGRFSPAHWKEVGGIDLLPGDGIIPLPEQKIALVRRGSRLAALSLECTHLGCLLNAVDQGFFCPCHGSQFGPLGEVYSGPATTSLPWYAIQMREGRLWVHAGQKRSLPQWLDLERNGDGEEKV